MCEEKATQTNNVSETRFAILEQSLKDKSAIDSELNIGRSFQNINSQESVFIQLVHKTVDVIFPYKKVHKSTQTFVNPVISRGEKLAREVVFYFLREDLHLVHEDPLSVCLRNVVTEMLCKHDIVFTRMVNCLKITPETAQKAFTEVADHLFISGGVTWGRIIALYAFAGRLALYCKEKRMDRLSRSIPLFMSKYIEDKIAPFVDEHGGWVQLCIEFPIQEHVNDKVWRYLLMTGASLGLVATLLAIHS